jgi:hypothetical protein
LKKDRHTMPKRTKSTDNGLQNTTEKAKD